MSWALHGGFRIHQLDQPMLEYRWRLGRNRAGLRIYPASRDRTGANGISDWLGLGLMR